MAVDKEGMECPLAAFCLLVYSKDKYFHVYSKNKAPEFKNKIQGE